MKEMEWKLGESVQWKGRRWYVHRAPFFDYGRLLVPLTGEDGCSSAPTTPVEEIIRLGICGMHIDCCHSLELARECLKSAKTIRVSLKED